jgi:hypothetical protein
MQPKQTAKTNSCAKAFTNTYMSEVAGNLIKQQATLCQHATPAEQCMHFPKTDEMHKTREQQAAQCHSCCTLLEGRAAMHAATKQPPE